MRSLVRHAAATGADLREMLGMDPALRETLERACAADPEIEREIRPDLELRDYMLECWDNPTTRASLIRRFQ